MVLIGDWDWSSISSNINIKEVIKYPHLPWDKDSLSHNCGINCDIINGNPKLGNATDEWNVCSLISHIVDIDRAMDMFPNWPWHISNIMLNYNITLKAALKCGSFTSNMYMISHLSSKVDIIDVLNNSHLQWCKRGLSSNKGITLDIVLNHNFPNATDDWDITALSHFIKDATNTPYEWFIKSRYSNINDVLHNPHLPWDRKGLSMNSSLILDVVDNLYLPNAVNDWDWSLMTKYINRTEIVNNKDRRWIKDSLYSNSTMRRDDCDWDELWDTFPNLEDYYNEDWGHPTYPISYCYNNNNEIDFEYIMDCEWLTIPDLYAIANISIPYLPYQKYPSSLFDVSFVFQGISGNF